MEQLDSVGLCAVEQIDSVGLCAMEQLDLTVGHLGC